MHKLTFSCSRGINYRDKYLGGAKINAVVPWHVLLIGFAADAPAVSKLYQPEEPPPGGLTKMFSQTVILQELHWSCLQPEIWSNAVSWKLDHFHGRTQCLLIIVFLSSNHIRTLESNKKQEGTRRPHFSCWLKSQEPQGLLTHFTGASSECPPPLFPPNAPPHTPSASHWLNESQSLSAKWGF